MYKDREDGETLIFGLYVGFILGAALACVLASCCPQWRW